VKSLAGNGSVTQKLADETLNQLHAAEASRRSGCGCGSIGGGDIATGAGEHP